MTTQQKIRNLEQFFRSVFTELFCLLTAIVRKSPNFIDRIRGVVLSIYTDENMKYQHGLLFDKHCIEIEKATDVPRFQSIFVGYCNFLNVSLLEHVVEDLYFDPFKNSDYHEHFVSLEKYKNEKLNVYIAHLQDFLVTTKLSHFIDALRLRQDGSLLKLSGDFVEIQLKMGLSWENGTLEEAERLRLDAADKAKIYSYTLAITDCKRCCIILTWGVTSSSVSSLLQVLNALGRERYDIETVDYDPAVVKPLSTEKPTLEPVDPISQVQPHHPVKTRNGEFCRTEWYVK